MVNYLSFRRRRRNLCPVVIPRLGGVGVGEILSGQSDQGCDHILGSSPLPTLPIGGNIDLSAQAGNYGQRFFATLRMTVIVCYTFFGGYIGLFAGYLLSAIKNFALS